MLYPTTRITIDVLNLTALAIEKAGKEEVPPMKRKLYIQKILDDLFAVKEASDV